MMSFFKQVYGYRLVLAHLFVKVPVPRPEDSEETFWVPVLSQAAYYYYTSL